MKQNHLPKVNFAQTKFLANHPEITKVEDSYRLAKTILRQGSLLPLPQIVQPVMWAYA
jgi:hypothetical protein